MLPFFGLLLSRPNFLPADLGIANSYTSTQAGSAAEITLTIATNGTWTLTVGAGDALGGTPTSGTWLNSGGVAADHQVRFTESNQVNSPTVTNGASSYAAVTVARTFKVEKTLDNASADCLVEIMPIGGANTVSDTTNLAANGA